LRNVSRAVEDGRFWKAVDAYTHAFKSWATASPGFHVRNAMSATFMNAVAGVTPASMMKGLHIWQAFRANPDGDWIKALSREDQAIAHDVVRAVYASGAGGQFSAAELGHVTESTSSLGRIADKVAHNKVTNSSANWGERVEGSARAAMAYDVLHKGGSIDEAIFKIKKFHFDYSEVNGLDKQMKRLIPFWTFMSRNIPLQIQMMWTNPRLYSQYQSFKRNFNSDPNGEQIMTFGVAERGGFRITDGTALAPDLPHTRVLADLERLGDPQRMLSNVNPLLRVPLEVLAHRQMYNDLPLNKEPTKLSNELAFLQLLGVTDTAGDGTKVVDQRIPYAIRNLVPPLGQIQRLFGTDDYYADRQGQSAANYVGLPIATLGPKVIEREQRRQAALSKKQGKQSAYAKALAEFAG
jgi:hypothetical protein